MTLECCRCLQFCTNIFVTNEHTTINQSINTMEDKVWVRLSTLGFAGTLNKPQLNQLSVL